MISAAGGGIPPVEVVIAMRVPTFALFNFRTLTVRLKRLARDPGGKGIQIRSGNRPGFSLVGVALATAVSAVFFSAIYTILRTEGSGDRDLRIRVDLHLDAVRVLREVTEALKGADFAGVESGGASPRIVFRRTGDGDGSSAIVLAPGIAGNELQLRRLDSSGAVVSQRVLGRHVDRIAFETAAGEAIPDLPSPRPPGTLQIRVTAWFRRVVDKKEYTARQAGIANLRSGGE